MNFTAPKRDGQPRLAGFLPDIAMSYAHGMHHAAPHQEPVACAKWRIAIYLLAMSMLEWAATAMLPEQARPAP